MWIGNVCPTKTRNNQNQGRVYDTHGIAPTLSSMTGGSLQPMVIVRGRENNNMKMVCERRIDEGLRTFKDDAIGTIRTIDSGVTNE